MRRTVLLLVVAVSAFGCRWKEDKFEQRLAEAYCDYAFECFTPSQLEIEAYGETVEECVQSWGPEYAGSVVGCTYDASAAKECVKQMEDLQCQEGVDPGSVLPAICANAYVCDGTGDTDDTDDTDTDA